MSSDLFMRPGLTRNVIGRRCENELRDDDFPPGTLKTMPMSLVAVLFPADQNGNHPGAAALHPFR